MRSFYDGIVSLGKAEKRIVELTKADIQNNSIIQKRSVVRSDTLPVSPDSAFMETLTLKAKAPVTITAPDDSTEIWINRESVAVGKWEGKLELGYYVLNTYKDSLESNPVPFWVDDELPKFLDLSAPMASYGLLNIHSNVVGATIYINKINRRSAKVRKYVRSLLSKAQECEFDGQGRIQLPQSLVGVADITKKCVIIGAADHLEIWSEERWDAYDETSDETFEADAETLTEFLK